MLLKQPKQNILSLLDESVYLTQEETIINPKEISIRENNNIDCNTVLFEDVVRISEQYNCSLNEAIEIIAEANDVPSCLLAVDLKEDMAILYPEVIDEMYQVVLSPMNQNDPIGLLVEQVVNEAIEQDDETIIESVILSEGTVNKIGNALLAAGIGGAAKVSFDAAKTYEKHKSMGGKHGWALGRARDPEAIDREADLNDQMRASLAVAGLGGALKGANKLQNWSLKMYKKYKDKPKNVVAKVIAKLRSKYEDIQKKLNTQAKSGKSGIFQKDSKLVNTLKKVGSVILNTIDKLMAAMQKTANEFS